MTKYTDSHNYSVKNPDIPISLPDYTRIESDSVDHYCRYCQFKLSRLIDSSGQNPSLYCSKCLIEYPDKTEVKTKSRLSTPSKSNADDPSVSYAVEPQLRRKKTEPKGTFKALKDKGIRITNYSEKGWRKTTYE